MSNWDRKLPVTLQPGEGVHAYFNFRVAETVTFNTASEVLDFYSNSIEVVRAVHQYPYAAENWGLLQDAIKVVHGRVRL